ncbi:NAD(P)H-dependent flavin oxidoreductase [Brackiella oedipodis]|uniref:NAD(P)H-dependent flavin oxidoreductase n=1 Tax=Brackiella oedipodis TaxID=124225 RepID=UPI0006854B39|nr:nitronate monooxygenase family protein [Brackiella oedipodis]
MENPYDYLTIRGRSLLPIVQGGMGVGISAHKLASAVARENAMGTIASIDLRHLHPDLLAESKANPVEENYDRLNHIALDREIKQALADSQGKGMIAVNVMKAVKDYAMLVKQSCESGAQAIVMGAGLPMELPDLTKDFPNVALLPILSESRGINLVLKRWMKKNRLPDAIIIEHPNHAGGHLGAPNMNELSSDRFSFKRVLEESFEVFKKLGLESEKIPLILAGGMANYKKIHTALKTWGANAVQIGTAFAVTQEGDAHENFKKTLRDAEEKDIVEFMSVAGLPARAVLTPYLQKYLKNEAKLQGVAKADPRRCVQSLNCLSVCGLRDGISKIGQFCIDQRLTDALNGDVRKGLFFRGKDPLPFGNQAKTVKDTIRYLLTGQTQESTECDISPQRKCDDQLVPQL